MKNAIKTAIAALIAVGTIASCIISSAAKTSGKTALIFGDSIATGYTLPGYNSSANPQAKDSWSTKLSETLGMTQYNAAVNGATTSDLAGVVTNPTNLALINRADLICISIGGNDFLHLLTAGIDFTNPAGSLPSVINSSIQKAPEVIGSAINNIDKTFKFIKSANPKATVAVETLYNPFAYWDFTYNGKDKVNDTTAKFIQMYNDALSAKIAEYGFIKVEVAEHFAANGNSSWLNGYCNSLEDLQAGRMNIDPHPSLTGHDQIFRTYMKALKAAGYTDITIPDTEVTTAEETTVEDTAVQDVTAEDTTIETNTSEVTSAEDATTIDTTETTPDETTATISKSGCRSLLIPALVPVLAGLGYMIFKRRED